MNLEATVVDALTAPAPAGWDRFVTEQRLPLGWDSSLLRAADGCAQAPSSLALVRDRVTGEPAALFHARHVGLSDPRRFAAPGRRLWPALTECRVTPNLGSGVAFADDLDPVGRAEAVRAFERAVGRRGGTLVRYLQVPADHLACLTAAGWRWVRPSHRMVLECDWPDLAGYLRSLPSKLRAALRRTHERVDAGDTVHFQVSDTADPQEASWLSEQVRRRRTSGRLPFPPWPATYFARLNHLPRARYLTYRDRQGRLLAFATTHEDGDELVSGVWGYRDEAEGGQRDLYFDVYLRQVALMQALGCRRLVLGQGMEHIKARLGAQWDARWAVWGVLAGDPRTGAGMAVPGPATTVAAPAGSVGASAGGGPAGVERLARAVRRIRPDVSAGRLACRQCGSAAAVVAARGRWRRVRYWCRSCQAITATAAPAPPSPGPGSVSDRPAGIPAPGAGTPAASPAEVMPAAMMRWIDGWARRPLALPRLTKPVIYQHYRSWDAHLAKLASTGRAALAWPGEPPPVPGLPVFSVVVTACQQTCYRSALVVERLAGQLPDRSGRARAAVWERAEHARRWLSLVGRDHCWIYDLASPGQPAAPAVVASARDLLRAGKHLPAESVASVREALFGTRRWPGMVNVLTAYPVEQLVAALDAYLRAGDRPLREDVLAHLHAPTWLPDDLAPSAGQR